ncbi:hypothetical protein BDZ85DRAFT_237096 [Elsinoe ampelina]|uniref:Ubiquitin-like domain-containing protein n=1 Tax=Elsinoe ampelina TaxID=302913 RepID=A0A6A6GCM6_9PEZI|nr:hypothetical protein BDZ85DRAFT_237096 [Elsinoe ampelina]
MGCCTSRPTPPTGEEAHAAAIPIPPNSSSLAAINAPGGHHSRSASHVSGHSQHHSPHRLPERNGSTGSRPNKPLRPPSPVQRCPPERALAPWTPSQLAKEREAFFDTRVTGDPEVWSALKIVCEMLRAGDVASAQGMMDAVGLTCPTGRIKKRRKGGVFDEQGRGYDIPGWVVGDPEDLVEEEVRGEKEKDSEGEESEDEKGKGRERNEGERVKVRARLSDKGVDVVVEVGVEQKVRVLVRRLQEKSGGKRMRLLYLGKILREDQSLREQGWQDGHVVNALVFE